MVQVLPQLQRRSFSDQINEGIQAAIPGIEKFMNQQSAVKAAKNLGIDPEVLKLPEQAQAEYFKNAFANEKGLNPLQDAQRRLAENKSLLEEEKLKFLREQQGQTGQNQEEYPQDGAFDFEGEIEQNEERPRKGSKQKIKGLIPESEIVKAALTFPNLANQMQQHNNNVMKEQRHEEDMAFKKSQAGKKYALEVHKDSQKYDEEIEHGDKVAKKQDVAINDIEKAINSGNVTPYSLSNVFKGMGPIGDKIANAMLNEDQATLLSSIPQLLEGWKQVFGVRLTDADLKLLEDKLPSIGKDEEANRAVLGTLKKYSEQAKLRGKIARGIKEKNNDLRPLGYSRMVEEEYEKMMSPISVYTPDGDIIEIPAFKLQDALENGASLANE